MENIEQNQSDEGNSDGQLNPVVSCLKPASEAPRSGIFHVVVTDKEGHNRCYLGKRLNGEWVGVHGFNMENMPSWIPYITSYLDVDWPDGIFGS